ncbi:hypothetical protein Sjap_009127 [Stephania japonica]|uniref:Uncharacterized protein n=1 Tax=Stephania japonica TaxID=461633 RepID=A0AAP0PBH1_9MAGN
MRCVNEPNCTNPNKLEHQKALERCQSKQNSPLSIFHNKTTLLQFFLKQQNASSNTLAPYFQTKRDTIILDNPPKFHAKTSSHRE